jgi:predicted transcriptional regulator
MALNTTHPSHLHYETPLLHLSVLGGIRLEGLDRLRVTLKIYNPETPLIAIRHNLDLYNDTQVEKLIRKTASKLEIGHSVIEACINELIEELESYRLKALSSTQEENHKKELSEAEKSEALQLLTTDNLLQTTNNLIGQSGMIGEETNRLIMYLIFTSRKRNQPLHVVSLGSSGIGKTHLQESIGNLIPDEEKIEITTLSENAFYYFGQQELKNKLILIEDLDGVLQALYPLRELQSKKKISKTIAFKNTKGETKSVHITVEGPVCVAGCTTQESLYEDNANRSFLLYLDESPKQDEKIMEYQRKLSAGKIDIVSKENAIKILKNSQRLLENIKIVNPYAEYLQLPKEILKPRRTNAHYLQFIEVVTYYSQYQRERKVDESTGEEYIKTTIEDIRNANELLKEVLIRKSDLLTGNSRSQLEKFKNSLENLGQTFTNLQLRYALKVTKTTAQRYLNQWQEIGLIKKMQNKETQTYYYQLIDENEYQNLENKINEILENALSEIENRTTETGRNISTDVSDKTNVEKEKEEPKQRNIKKDKTTEKTE